jgi:hypothetical protein
MAACDGDHTRTYLCDFRAALAAGSAEIVEARMRQKYPHHHAKQFLTVFSLPAYFPPPQN